MDSEIPSWWAFTVVAPIVRFNALEIFATPTFFLASDFISRRSDEVHARRVVLFLVGILSSLLWGARLLSHKVHLAMRQLPRFCGATLRSTPHCVLGPNSRVRSAGGTLWISVDNHSDARVPPCRRLILPVRRSTRRGGIGYERHCQRVRAFIRSGCP
jgi:hypothetical protein